MFWECFSGPIEGNYSTQKIASFLTKAENIPVVGNNLLVAYVLDGTKKKEGDGQNAGVI